MTASCATAASTSDADEIICDEALRADPVAREQALDKLRKKMKKADLAAEHAAAIGELQAKFPAGTPIRCRSSTNNEDLEGFNGAGLYDSFTHRPDEGDLSKTVKQVWASLWNFRAYDERDFHRIDHLGAAMGVLVHPNFDDELANGVAVTKNPYDPVWPGFYVNVQVGESLVTNPDPNATPDELLDLGDRRAGRVRDAVHPPLDADDRRRKPVMTREQVAGLTGVLETIQARFKAVYGKERRRRRSRWTSSSRSTPRGELAVKQARPWVE